MRRRDITRMWAQIVNELGVDKYTSQQWQEGYEDFWRCMLPNTEPYIRIESIESAIKNAMKSDDEDDQSREESPSSAKLSETEPLAAWIRRLKRESPPESVSVELKKSIKDEKSKPTKAIKLKRKSLTNDGNSLSKEKAKKKKIIDEKKETKVQKPQIVTKQQKKKECEPKWRIENKSTQQSSDNQTVETKQRNTKMKSKTQSRFPNLEKEEKIILKISKVPIDQTKQPDEVKPSEKQVKKVETQQQSSQDPKLKLKRASRKSQSKHEIVINANTEEAHKLPTAINLKINTASVPSVPLTNSITSTDDDAENLSFPKFRNSEEQKVDVLNPDFDQTNICENPIKSDKLIDIFTEPEYELDDVLLDDPILSSPLAEQNDLSQLLNNENNVGLPTLDDYIDDVDKTVEEGVGEIDLCLQSFTNQTPSEIDQEITKSSEFFNRLSGLTTDINKTPLELDALMQDVLNYDEDDDDIISVATSWDGDTENNLQAEAIEEQPILKSVVTKLSKELTPKEPQNQKEVKSHLSELRSFRIPKQSARTTVSPAVEAQEEKGPRPIEKEQEQPQNKKPESQVQQQKQPARIVNLRRTTNGTAANPSGRAAPVFAPPYRVPAEPMSASIEYQNNDSKAAIFGIKCWPFLVARCRKNNCNHSMNSIGEVQRRLDQMNKMELCGTYSFVLRYNMLFKTYFVLFANVFGSRLMLTHLVKMIQDCGLYMSQSAPLLNDIFHVLLRYQMLPEIAAGHFMRHLWKPNNAAMYPELTRQLLHILSQADWYNYMENLEQIFYGEKFPIPGDFLTSIARDAVAKNQPMLISKVWELVLFNPIGRNADTLSSVIEILNSYGQPQQQQQSIPQQQQSIPQQQQSIPQQHPRQQQHRLQHRRNTEMPRFPQNTQRFPIQRGREI